MTIIEFQNLTSAEQMYLIEIHGAQVGTREDGRSTMFLYQVYAFYVEIVYNKKDGMLWKMGYFDHPILLGPYLDQIDISNLLNH